MLYKSSVKNILKATGVIFDHCKAEIKRLRLIQTVVAFVSLSNNFWSMSYWDFKSILTWTAGATTYICEFIIYYGRTKTYFNIGSDKILCFYIILAPCCRNLKWQIIQFHNWLFSRLFANIFHHPSSLEEHKWHL